MIKLTAPWAMERTELEQKAQSNAIRGLNAKVAESRLKESGENKITHSKKITFWDILWEEVREPLILMLLVIGVLYSIWGDIGDAIMIICVILAVSLVEVYTEYKAKKNIESLKTLAQPTSWVMRDGKSVEVQTSQIVCGDVLILKNGVKVSADARVIESNGLEADESQLTGESMGILKIAEPIAADTGLNDRKNMVHMGSVIRGGKGMAVVTATGMDTELGRIAGLTEEAREPKTPLQKSMKQLSKTLIWVAVFFSVLVPVINILRNLPITWSNVQENILTGLSFAFATIPEEMPIIITMVLGLGSIKLANKNVLIKRTKAAETLGSVTVIATDKTGTLTENKMSIHSYHAKDDILLFTLAALTADETDDPMDISSAAKARALGIDIVALCDEYELVREYGLDETTKTLRYDFRHEGKPFTILKGASESVLALSEPDNDVQARLAECAGLRTIAVAYGEEALTVAGLICFDDRIRKGVPEAIESCKQAGVKVIMITGDHAATARRVAESAGIEVTGVLTGKELAKIAPEGVAATIGKYNVFARISPEQKLNIVNALRENGEVIAVTGDGINDAPALKAADIGIAMGVAGTDVAKEAADMILTDDSFTGSVTAIEEGRRLFDNLSKCVKYYLACKVGLILSILIPTLMNIPLPFSPIQIIILELFMDLAASTSFVVEKAENDLLKRKPRNAKESFMNKRMVSGIFSSGITLAVIVLGIYLYNWFSGGDVGMAQTYAFIAWLFGHVALAFNTRTFNVPLVKMGVFSSRAFNIWMCGVVAFLTVVLNIPVLREYLRLGSVGLVPVLCLAGIAIVVTSWIEIRKWIVNN